MSTLKEKIECVEIEKGMLDNLEKIADDYAIEFAMWFYKLDFEIVVSKTLKEHLEIFKKQKGY